MKTHSLLLILISLVTLQACTEIFSNDISGETILLLSPSDSSTSNKREITFFWEENPDIEQYRLRMVSPDFVSPELILDTITASYTLKFSLDSMDAEYIWEIQGINEGSETGTFRRKLYADFTSPQIPGSLIPDGDTLRTEDSLRWTSQDNFLGVVYPTADSLIISAVNDSTIFSPPLVQPENVRYKSIDDLALSQGEYFWKIISLDKAGNRSSSRLFRFYFNPN